MADTTYRFVFEDDGAPPGGSPSAPPPPRTTFPPSQGSPGAQGSSSPGAAPGREERPIVRRSEPAEESPLRQFLNELAKLPIIGQTVSTGVNVFDKLSSAAAALERLASTSGPLWRLGEIGPIFRSAMDGWASIFGGQVQQEPIRAARTVVETVATAANEARRPENQTQPDQPIRLPAPENQTQPEPLVRLPAPQPFEPVGSQVVRRDGGDLIIPPRFQDRGEPQLPIVRPTDAIARAAPVTNSAVSIYNNVRGGPLSTAVGGIQAAQLAASLGFGPLAVAATAVTAAFVAAYKATEIFSSAVTKRASELQPYSAALSVQSAASEVADLRATMRSANNYGDTFARYNATTADQNRALREIADGVMAKFADDLQPIRVILGELLSGVAAVTPYLVKGAQYTEEGVPFLRNLKDIAFVIEWFRGREEQKNDPLGILAEFEKFAAPLDTDAIDAGTARNNVQFNAIGGVQLP